MDNRPPSHRRRLATRLLIGAAIGLGVVFSVGVLLEVTYRLAHGIPFTGGTLYQEQLRMPDSVLSERPWYRDFLARFRPSDNPILFYEPRPGYRGFFGEGSAPGAEIQINSQGFRDHEYSPEKDAETFRVVVLGDSIMWGHGLTLEDTFAKQLERLLVERQKCKVEILNFGVSGYSTQQEVELYRVKASRFHPDLVIVGYCLNDYEESSVEGQAFRRLYYDVFTHSYACERLQRLACGLFEDFGRWFEDSERQSDLREQFELLRSYCGATRIVVVIFPELTDFRHYHMLYQHERVLDALKGLDCEILDLLAPFSRFEPEALQLTPRDHTHPNALGTRVAAAATLDLFLREDLLPPGSGQPSR